MGQKGQEQGGEWGHCEREATIGSRVLRVCVCEVGGGGYKKTAASLPKSCVCRGAGGGGGGGG